MNLIIYIYIFFLLFLLKLSLEKCFYFTLCNALKRWLDAFYSGNVCQLTFYSDYPKFVLYNYRLLVNFAECKHRHLYVKYEITRTLLRQLKECAFIYFYDIFAAKYPFFVVWRNSYKYNYCISRENISHGTDDSIKRDYFWISFIFLGFASKSCVYLVQADFISNI